MVSYSYLLRPAKQCGCNSQYQAVPEEPDQCKGYAADTANRVREK